jgi:hypothetical protein
MIHITRIAFVLFNSMHYSFGSGCLLAVVQE